MTQTPDDWLYRHVDKHGVVHVEAKRTARRGALKTACGMHVNFGETWLDVRSIVVTCLQCLGAR